MRVRVEDDDDSSSTSSGSSFNNERNDDEAKGGVETKSMDTKVMRMHEVYPARNIKGATATTEHDESYYAQDEVELGAYDETQSTVPPVEEFDFQGALYHAYISEEGFMYYLDMHSGHSQWDDPRVYGLATDDPQVEQNLETLLDNQYAHLNSAETREQYFTKVLDFGADDDDDENDLNKSDLYRSFSNDDTETDNDFSPDAVKLRVIPRDEYKSQSQDNEGDEKITQQGEDVQNEKSSTNSMNSNLTVNQNAHFAKITESLKQSTQDSSHGLHDMVPQAPRLSFNEGNTIVSTPTKSPRKGRPPPIEILPTSPCTPQQASMAARKRSPGQSSPYSTPSNRSIASNSSTPTHSISQRSTPTHRNVHTNASGATSASLSWSKVEEEGKC